MAMSRRSKLYQIDQNNKTFGIQIHKIIKRGICLFLLEKLISVMTMITINHVEYSY